jgi:Raf kinase inhibitor-like YbhB/YbcL family protein
MMRMTSASFDREGPIPSKYTSDGENISPPLAWTGAPPGTKSFALIVDDPDAPDPKSPRMTWVHWIAFDIPPEVSAIAEGDLPDGAREGLNDWRGIGWRGPSPPVGRHRYFHKLYALDTTLPNISRPDKATLERAMRGHVLAETSLVGTYEKKH